MGSATFQDRVGSLHISLCGHIHLQPNVDSADRERKDTDRVQVLTGLSRGVSHASSRLLIFPWICYNLPVHLLGRLWLQSEVASQHLLNSSSLCLAICHIPFLASICLFFLDGWYLSGTVAGLLHRNWAVFFSWRPSPDRVSSGRRGQSNNMRLESPRPGLLARGLTIEAISITMNDNNYYNNSRDLPQSPRAFEERAHI